MCLVLELITDPEKDVKQLNQLYVEFFLIIDKNRFFTQVYDVSAILNTIIESILGSFEITFGPFHRVKRWKPVEES